MFGEGHTYFVNSPVVIKISGLYWGETVTSPFTVVRVQVKYASNVVGEFRADTGGQTEISFDISSALRAVWSDRTFDNETEKANNAISSSTEQSAVSNMRPYFLCIYKESLSSDDGGVFTTTQCEDRHGNTDIPGGQCLPGSFTEWERSLIADDDQYDVATLEHTGVRNGNASTKPISSPERVGRNSITSWVDVQPGYAKSIFYPPSYNEGMGENDDVAGRDSGWTGPSCYETPCPTWTSCS